MDHNTFCFIRSVVVEFENNDIVPGHVLLVEPTVARVINNFVCLIMVMWKYDISLDEIVLVDCSEVAKCERRILDRSRNRPPYAAMFCVKVSNSLADGLRTSRSGL